MTGVKPWNGVPLHPERDGWHWVVAADPSVSIESAPWWWSAANQHWLPPCDVSGALPLSPAQVKWRYLGPCHTPAEVHEQLAAARREAWEEAARVAKRLTDQWRNDQQRGGVAYGEAIIAAIRALAEKGGGDE